MPDAGRRLRKPHPESRPGRVVASYGRRVLIEDDQRKRLNCQLKGRRLKAVCGDHVEWYPDSHNGVVTAIAARRNELRRPDSRGRVEILAANISQLVVVIAPTPPVDEFLADRYLAAARLMGADSLVVCNKSDLGGVDLAGEYRTIGYPVVSVSAKTSESMESLATALTGHTSILVGQSGVGKSALSNTLIPGLAVATQTLSEGTGEGKHTTSTAILHHLPDGGEIIDSPGVRDFAPPPTELKRVEIGFPEFDQAMRECRFNDCLHLKEPQCGVRTAVDSGEISARRYRSYRELLHLMRRLMENPGG
ncbi:MAG: ribosome small subunit-dependent GTPase A [Proteobacteria bacterium]|nr:ribosome small subunit-dependent GTPase A [Pseudomonadota bacterium]